MTKVLDLTDIQGNVVRAYGRFGFPRARYFFLHISDGDKGRQFIATLIDKITSSVTWDEGPNPVEKPKATTNIAFTFKGLQALGLPVASLNSFPQDFIMGMKSRKAILGDDGPSEPVHWDPIWDDEKGPRVHAWISINAQFQMPGTKPDYLEERYQLIEELIQQSDGGVTILSGHRGPSGVDELAYQDASILWEKDGKPSSKEHFGYTDGISDPVFEGKPAKPGRVLGRGKLTADGGWEPLATGEFILGHPDEAKEYPPAPSPQLLSRNGTFMVYRKLHENVATFDRFLEQEGQKYPGGKALLAAKWSGRWSDNGAPVVSAPDQASKDEWDKKFNQASEQEKDKMLSDFTYDSDMSGAKCPFASHARRINPRGSLRSGFDAEGRLELRKEAYDTPGALVNRRRIMRRGLPYGDSTERKDEGDHGIIFMVMGADIKRQFEFVQQQWINYGNDFKEGNDKEVLLGNHPDPESEHPSKIVIQVDQDSDQAPYFVNKIPRLVETRGGDYFFVPSITALRMIAGGVVDPT